MLTTIRIHIILREPDMLTTLRIDLAEVIERYRNLDSRASLAIDHTEDFR